MRVVLAAIAVLLLVPSGAVADVVLHPEDPFTSSGAALAVGDYDGDGHVDVLTDGGVSLGDGHGAFAAPIAGAAATALAPAADFNGDHKLDVAAVRGGVPTVDDGDGAGHFAGGWQPSVLAGYTVAAALTATDVDGDGRDDLAVAYDGGVRVFTGQADGTLTQTFASPFAGATHGTAIDWGDVDHDGNVDLLIGTSDSGLLVARGHGDGSFDAPAGTDTGAVTALYADDFHGDGFVDDVVYAKQDTGLWERSGTDAPHRLIAFPATSITAADLDADGHLDAVVTVPGGELELLHGTGSGFADPQAFPLDHDATAVAAADVNEDGVDDLVAASAAAGAYVVRNAPRAVASSPSLTFADAYAGFAAPSQVVAVTNAGAAPLHIGAVAVEGAGFALAANRCHDALAGGVSCSAGVGFTPPGAGAFAGALTVTGDDPAGILRVPLAGRGVAPPSSPPIAPPLPQPVNSAATAASALAKNLAKLGLRRLSRSGTASVSFKAPAAGALTLIVGDLKGRRLGSGSLHIAGPTSRTVNVVFSKATRRKAKTAKSLTVRVKATFVLRAGGTQRASVKVKLKR